MAWNTPIVALDAPDRNTNSNTSTLGGYICALLCNTIKLVVVISPWSVIINYPAHTRLIHSSSLLFWITLSSIHPLFLYHYIPQCKYLLLIRNTVKLDMAYLQCNTNTLDDSAVNFLNSKNFWTQSSIVESQRIVSNARTVFANPLKCIYGQRCVAYNLYRALESSVHLLNIKFYVQNTL